MRIFLKYFFFLFYLNEINCLRKKNIINFSFKTENILEIFFPKNIAYRNLMRKRNFFLRQKYDEEKNKILFQKNLSKKRIIFYKIFFYINSFFFIQKIYIYYTNSKKKLQIKKNKKIFLENEKKINKEIVELDILLNEKEENLSILKNILNNQFIEKTQENEKFFQKLKEKEESVLKEEKSSFNNLSNIKALLVNKVDILKKTYSDEELNNLKINRKKSLITTGVNYLQQEIDKFQNKIKILNEINNFKKIEFQIYFNNSLLDITDKEKQKNFLKINSLEEQINQSTDTLLKSIEKDNLELEKKITEIDNILSKTDKDHLSKEEENKKKEQKENNLKLIQVEINKMNDKIKEITEDLENKRQEITFVKNEINQITTYDVLDTNFLEKSYSKLFFDLQNYNSNLFYSLVENFKQLKNFHILVHNMSLYIKNQNFDEEFEKCLKQIEDLK